MTRLLTLLICIGSLTSIPAASLLGVANVSAQGINGMFPIMSHDFGTVAVASKTEFVFPIKNTTGSEMHIREVRASCGCTTPILASNYIPANGEGSLTARFNTGTFRGKKGATLTVVIDKPFFTEVLLKVDGYIRSDMVFHPGSVEFGSINQGEDKTGATKIYYAGRSDWQVVDFRASKPWLIPKFTQVERGPGKATYELSVQVREDAPEGFFQDEVIVQTNDRSMPRVPLRVTGNVVTALSISPQSIALGNVKPDQEIIQRLVITGREPFAIESIECPGWKVSFDPAAKQTKKIHFVNVTLSPGADTQGAQRVPMVIKTAGEKSVTAKAVLTAEITNPQVAAAN